MVKGNNAWRAATLGCAATVRNLDAWYRAFDVQPGQQLYLAPQQRVRAW